MDVLSHLICKTIASGLIIGVKAGLEEVVISHLHLAYDTILFLENDKDSFLNTFSPFLSYIFG